MAYSIAKVFISGNLTRDIELKYAQSGTAIATLSVATNRRIKKNGEWEDKPCFTDCTCFGKTAEMAADMLSKGSVVVIEGELDMDTWERDGQKRSKHVVMINNLVMPGAKGKQAEPQQRQQSTQQSSPPQRQSYATEDIPF